VVGLFARQAHYVFQFVVVVGHLVYIVAPAPCVFAILNQRSYPLGQFCLRRTVHCIEVPGDCLHYGPNQLRLNNILGQILSILSKQQGSYTMRQFLQHILIHLAVETTCKDINAPVLKYNPAQQLTIGLGLLGLADNVIEYEVHIPATYLVK